MLFLLLLIAFVGSVLIGLLVPIVFKSERPYGLAGDILVPTIVGVGWTFILYQYIVPLVNLGGPLAFFGSILEGLAFAAITLWIMRRIKK